ncbi:MAG TPA: glycosyltransferase family 1 protein, partial [Longimicrobium sp.]|nr:glycosyltransferase family 1 protein [Longimicrobium sp.]
ERLRTRLALPPRYFLFLGVITPRKNVGNLCRAFQRYVDAGGDAHLVMAGAPDGHGENVPEQTCTGAALARIHRLGYVPHGDLPALYSGARALVYPSRYEGFGLPMLEAMACGTPVLAARAGSLPEVAGDAALFFDPDDVQGIADGMLRVDRDGEVADTLRTRGHARAAQFDWASVAAHVENLYERICTGGG